MILVLLVLSGTKAKAVTYNDDEVYGMAPDSLNIDITSPLSPDPLFVNGKYTKGFSPTVQDGKRLVLPTSGSDTAITSAWSNADNNYININQRQNISFWIYMGRSNSSSQGAAFVLQNADDPISIANNNGTIVGGETIGVWGDDTHSRSNESALAKTAIPDSWALEFDTLKNGPDGSTTTGDAGDYFDAYQKNWGGGRSLESQHVAWGYPGDASTYEAIGTSGSLLNTKKYYLQNHQDPENLITRMNSEKRLAWHHVTIVYNPPESDSNIATLTYKVNDKDIYGIDFNHWGNIPFEQSEIGHTVPLDLSKFNLNSNKLRFGFVTASAPSQMAVIDDGANTNILFETLPGLIQADTNAYIVNSTGQNKIIETDPHQTTNTEPNLILNSEDKGLATATRAHPGDSLKFKYLLNYISGRSNIDNATAKISLPDNINFETDPSKQLGEIKYEDGNSQIINGQTPTIEKDADGNPYKQITVQLDHSVSEDDKYATISIDGKATDLPINSQSIIVPPSHAQITSDQFKADLETKSFIISTINDTLTLTKTSTDPQTVYNTDKASLTGHWAFDKLTTATNDDIEIHYSVDGGAETVIKDTAHPKGDFQLDLTGLTAQKHEITVYAVNHNYPVAYDDDNKVSETDTIMSKPVTYTVKVEKKALQIDSKSGKELTATGNMDVGVDGTQSYNDGSSFKNDDLTLHTVVNGTDTTTKLSGSDVITSGKFSANIQAKYLKVGDTNPVEIYMKDADGLESNHLNYNVTVPDTKLTITPDNTDIKALLTENAIIGGKINYADDTTNFKPSDITLNINIDGTDQDPVKLTGDTSDVSTKFQHAMSGESLQTGEHTVTVTATDIYGRTSDPVTYKVDVIDKSLVLDSSPTYHFKTINSSDETQIVPRADDWKLKVESINSTWALTAQCTELHERTTGNDLAGGLIYTNSDGAIQSMQDSQVKLASDHTVSMSKKITDIAGEWTQSNGILLKVMPMPVRGTYDGTISWNLTESV